MKYMSKSELRELIPSEYSIDKTENIECISSTAAVLRHIKSGARVAVFINEDENKLFSAAFRTPPIDDCGTPHIIEHSVLCGSERYPVKDPFMQLVKSSMQTFLNAMTYADKTVYPVSSCNDADFVNLSNIYLDAVFAPNIIKHKEIFMQEGWHYEPTENGGLDIGGVVYSEMMGAMSSPDSNVYDGLITSLFPDNAYGKNSGGDPEAIPTLTYEKFLEFYNTHYHPSNCYITLYGNMDVRERLTYIDREYLSKYDAIEVDTGIAEQKPFDSDSITRNEKTYPIPVGEDPEGKTFLAFGAACADTMDVIDCYAIDFLSDILVESPGAPVKTALIGAGIGQEVYGGFLNHMTKPVFSVIAKSTNKAEADRFLDIVRTTLSRVAEDGVNKKSLEAAISRSEFRFREGEQGSTSRGLNVNLSMLQNWLYSDEAPFEYIKADKILAELKARIYTGYYENLVKRILDEKHSTLFILSPEEGLNEKKAAELRCKLDEFRASLTDSEYDTICDEYETFVAYQDREESEAELACIPLLSKDDVSKSPSPVYVREGSLGDTKVVFHDIDTNGIAYVRFMFDISHIPNDDLPYLDILSSVLGKTDTRSSRYEDILDEVRLNTGGFGFVCETYRCKDRSFRPMYELNIRALADKFNKALKIAEEIISGTNLQDHGRIREILSEMVSEKQRDIVSAGSEYATARALAYFSPADAAEDHLDGITAYFIEKDLLEKYESVKDKISFKLTELVKSIFVKDRCMVSIAADDKIRDSVSADALRFVSKLNTGEEVSPAVREPLGHLNEAFMTTSQVQYAAIAGNLNDAGYEYSGKYTILTSFIKNDYLYPEIRMKGGAYGYSCTFSVNSGNVCMFTYRDPCLAESYDVFSACGDYVRSIAPTESELTKHIIGTFGRVDRPMSAYMKASRSLATYMSGRTYNDMQRDRDEMLNVTAEDLRLLAEPVDCVMGQHYICVIGNEEKILENKHLFGKVIRLN